MTAPIFVDTNVLVYARDARAGRKCERANAWLETLWREQTGRTSLQVLSEYYVTVTRKLRPGMPADEAWDDVRALLAWRPCPIDRSVLERARTIEARYGLSWWDSLVVSAAEQSDCAMLLTEDLQDGARYGSVTVRNPFADRAAEPAAAYAAASVATPAHPPRGRPRRATRQV